MKIGYIDKPRLKEIRDNADWHKMISAFGLEVGKMTDKEIMIKCPWTSEKTASLHVTLPYVWKSFSGDDVGGGPIEFVQEYMRNMMGKSVHCYEAGRILVERGVSHLDSDPLERGPDDRGNGQKSIFDPPTEDRGAFSARNAPRGEKKKISGSEGRNSPISFNLVPLLTQQGEHEQFSSRGISAETCNYLGCGYLDQEENTSYQAGRVVFQVRGLDRACDARSVILTHIGRATTENQIEKAGKWKLYPGFKKTLELYNQDKAMLDPAVIEKAKRLGFFVLSEGCFDVAKLVEAGFLNSLATFGSTLDEKQILRLGEIAKHTGVKRFFVWYDRDESGRIGQERAVLRLREAGFDARGFDWDRVYENRGFRENIKDVCDFSVRQIIWMRDRDFF